MNLETLGTLLELVRGYAMKIEGEYPETSKEIYHDANKVAFAFNSYGYPVIHLKACLATIKNHLEVK